MGFIRIEWKSKREDAICKKNTVKSLRMMLKENSSQCQIGKKQDKILGFWLKPFTALHKVLATVLNKCKEVGYVPDWLVEGRTILVIKYSEKNTEVRSYRPITCLSLICTLLAGIISDQTYDHLEENKLFPGDKKRSRRKCQGATDAYSKIAGKEKQI